MDARRILVCLVVLQTWPEVMMRSTGRDLDPLAEAIVWMINNSGRPSDMTILKVSSLKLKLSRVQAKTIG